MIELRPAKYLLGRLVPMDNNDKIPLFNLGSGTYDNTKFLRGDGTWAVPSGGGGSYVPYTGATGNVNLGEYGLSAGWLRIDTSPTTYVAGTGGISWNSIDGTADLELLNGVTLQIGQELHFYAKATEIIPNGSAVMFAGVQGDHLLIAKANSAVLNSNPNYFMGVATQDFINNEFGYVTAFGNVRGLNTTAYSLGSILYFDSTSITPGLLTATMPNANLAKIEVAAVVRVHATQGILMVRPHIMPTLNEIQDVNTNLSKTNPIDADSVLLQDTADINIWKKLSWANIKATLKTYFDTLYQDELTLTTTGTSGAATLVGATLNIPQYSGGGGGGSGLQGIHAIVPLLSGDKTNVTLVPSGGTSGNAFIANRVVAYPFIPNQNITSSDLYMNVSSAVAASSCRIAIYSDVNGKPDTQLFLSSTIDCSTIGIKTALTTFNFIAGTTYWLTFHGGTVASSVTQIAVASTCVIKAQAAIGNMGNSYYFTYPFITGTPTNFAASPILQAVNVPLIGITKA